MLAVFGAGVLAAVIRVVQQAGRRLPAPERHPQGLHAQGRPHVAVGGLVVRDEATFPPCVTPASNTTTPPAFRRLFLPYRAVT